MPQVRYGECSGCWRSCFTKEPIMLMLEDGRAFTTGQDLYTCVFCERKMVAPEGPGPKKMELVAREGKQMIESARKDTLKALEAMGVGV